MGLLLHDFFLELLDFRLPRGDFAMIRLHLGHFLEDSCGGFLLRAKVAIAGNFEEVGVHRSACHLRRLDFYHSSILWVQQAWLEG